MEIISIDPEPRLSIAQLCDQVYRVHLEDFNCDEFLSLVTSDTLIFFDGSHRVFPSSDVTVFFLNLLPSLPKGCIVHIHDIYLPNDYPPELQNRIWSEQYLLAAYLLGGAKHLQVLLPCAHLASNQLVKEIFAESFATQEFPGCSFWIKIV
ncbi:class I SAM-dependent methyltransferase [Pseudanabaena sp. FACHB-1998]|uniref:class I SAM-dependent methyltransferase n=1 Tax=Pseudanabaena sp. FACHB-1998 TaxID=2692858 RepID=UPI0016805D83|nr:class I SAM-dependent methyltransferase [Pseudanabaena sp. FACHB-1998]MBD2176628.1 class I SAM-dependent methyltransferase [Pseudanabaena sp. FACHB-1998]